jgi:hypothetical protein
MSVLAAGLLMVFLLYALLLGACFGIMMWLPGSILSTPAKTLLNWLPPYLRGKALRNWAAATAEQLAKERLGGKRSACTGVRLAADVEAGAMQAMLPEAEPSDLERIMACPEAGQRGVGVTAPEALAIAAYLRENRSRAEQQRIYELAVENARKIADRGRGEGDLPPLPCPLHGQNHVCCAYGTRPLRCRPLHAIAIARDMRNKSVPTAGSSAEAPDEMGHEHTVAQGIEIGLTRALKSAGVDARVYELNSALATVLNTPDAAERWANGDNVFDTPLP